MVQEINQQECAAPAEEQEIIDPQEDDDGIIPFPYAISSYGADYDVEGLVRRIKADDIVIPEFQRKYVWTLPRASRLIESLLLGLPVPGIFLALEPESQKLLVIDGQQRLMSLYYFYTGKYRNRREFALKGVQPEFEGKTYAALSPVDRRRLDNSIIHATVIKQDDPKEEDSSSIYYIFERLNTGGVALTPQEIRASIYRGALQRLLHTLNDYPAWRKIYGPANVHMKDQELILRFFALYYDSDSYSKPLVDFLNRYMKRNRNLQLQSEIELVQLFTNTIDTVERCLGRPAFRPKGNLNAPVYDAVMVGIAKRLENGPMQDCSQLQAQHKALLAHDEFVRLYESGTTDEANMRRRIGLAIETFKDVS